MTSLPQGGVPGVGEVGYVLYPSSPDGVKKGVYAIRHHLRFIITYPSANQMSDIISYLHLDRIHYQTTFPVTHQIK